MKINGYEIVVSALSDNLNSQKAVGRMAHILREAKQTKKLKYLRGSAKDNKYFIQNNFGVLQELSYSGNLTYQEIKGMINKQLLKFQGDYENQYITDKNGKSKKRAWQKKMTPFTEVLIVFGTQRPKEEKEGLNKEESDFINGLEITHNAMTFINEYCKKYGVECIAAAEHNDEKTKHWHIFFTNYDCINHACIRRKKKEMSEYGKELQDMSADTFSRIAVRGLRGSNAVHRKLKLMHKIEQEFKDQQELKGSIRKLVVENLQGLFTKQKPFMFGSEYYRLETENAAKLISKITDIVFKKAKENMTIVQESFLLDQINELNKQLMNKGEIISKNKELETSKELLFKENSELKELNDTFKDKDIVVSQKEKIKKLEEFLGQKEALIADLKNMISNNEEIIIQAKKDKEQLKKLKDIEGTNLYLNSQIKAIKQDNSDLKGKIKEQENQGILIDELNEEKNILRMKLSKALGNNTVLEKSNERLTKENDILRQENTSLKEFKRKVINFFKNFMDKVSVIKSFIENEVPNIKSEVAKGEFAETRIS
jgi:hypothetical protein